MNIGIVGGSIAGCSAAILLQRAGHKATVFERSKKALVGRGGGIGTLQSLIQQLIEEHMLDRDFPNIDSSELPFIGKHPGAEPFGHVAWAVPIQFSVFQWNAIWQNLRSKVPDSCYRAGAHIVDAVMQANDQVQLTAADGSRHHFDLVLFADGYKSLGRKIIFPESTLQYRGYVLWRGLLPESEITSCDRLEHSILRLSYPGQPGHNVMYYIPGVDGAMEPGKRVLNWAAYIAVPPEDLDNLMTDRTGRVRSGTLPPGAITEANEDRLKDFLADLMPDFYADIVRRTPDTYIQVIYTLDLDHYYKGRMCLIGDAGMVIQPFTGSGVFKGYSNVKDLISALQAFNSLEQALESWSHAQIRTGKRLLALGMQMEDAFIWNQPDFAEADAAFTERWWKTSVNFPDNFQFEKR